jgi:uncharacterized Zn finger protein
MSAQGYAEACRLVERVRNIRSRQGEEGAYRTYILELVLRHKRKRNFINALELRSLVAPPIR